MYYSVSVLFSALHDAESVPEEDTMWEEVVYWISASDRDAAAEQAERAAKRDEHEYDSVTGNRVRWKFQQVTHVSPMEYDRARNGEEIFSRFLTAEQARVLSRDGETRG